jgi:hypothetical protein
MSNVLSEEKRQQVIALGRLGWSLRRIEQATGVRRETGSAYLKAAGIGVRAPGAWGRQVPAKPANEVTTGSKPELFVFYKPPMVNRNLGIRRYINEATRVAKETLARKLQTIVFANSRLHTEVMLTYLQQANPPKPGQPEPIRGYRGGYLPT